MYIYICICIYIIFHLCVGAAWPQKEPTAEVVVAKTRVPIYTLLHMYAFVLPNGRSFDSTGPFSLSIYIYIYIYIYMIVYLCVGAAWPEKEPTVEVVVHITQITDTYQLAAALVRLVH